MRPAWLEAREESCARRAALLPLGAAALLYGAGAAFHRAVYQRGWRRAAHLPCKVVSVGNLVAGGSGKTPTAAWLAARLRERGHRVALASRGHGRQGREPVVVVSDGQVVRCGVREAGDEPLLLAAHAPGVPVLVGSDRVVVGLRAVAAFGAEVLVLDDGFQHHRLARDVELLTFDGRLGLGNRHVLPRGPLRESLAALQLAHVIGVVDGPLPEPDEAALRSLAPHALRFEGRRHPVSIRALGSAVAAAPASLAGTEVGLLAGIAQPASLRRTLEGLGARIVAERVFPDHHRYRAADLAGLTRAARIWVTTEKDAVKLLPAWTRDCEVRVLGIELEVAQPTVLLEWLEARLR